MSALILWAKRVLRVILRRLKPEYRLHRKDNNDEWRWFVWRGAVDGPITPNPPNPENHKKRESLTLNNEGNSGSYSERFWAPVWATGLNNSNVTILFLSRYSLPQLPGINKATVLPMTSSWPEFLTQSKTKNSLLGTDENQRQHLKILPGTASNKRLGSRTYYIRM